MLRQLLQRLPTCRPAAGAPAPAANAPDQPAAPGRAAARRPASLLDGEHALIRHLAEQPRPATLAAATTAVCAWKATPTWCGWSPSTSPRAWNTRWSCCRLRQRPAGAARGRRPTASQRRDAYGRLRSLLTLEDERLALADRERLQRRPASCFTSRSPAPATRCHPRSGAARGKSNTLHESALGHLIKAARPSHAGVDGAVPRWLAAEHRRRRANRPGAER